MTEPKTSDSLDENDLENELESTLESDLEPDEPASSERVVKAKVPPPKLPPPPPGAPKRRPAIPAPAKAAPAEPRQSSGSDGAPAPISRLPRFASDALVRELVAAYERELALDPEPATAVLLHHGLAWVYEAGAGDPDRALEHYRKATALDSTHQASVHAMARIALAQDALADALPLLETEARGSAAAETRAALRYRLGRAQQALGDLGAARASFQATIALDARHLVALGALARIEHAAGRWGDLASLYEHLARAVSDPSHRAAILVQRASLLEMRLESRELAADVYEAALGLDPHALGARAGLDRIRHATGRHAERIALCELRAEQSDDPETKALALHEAARIHADRLGNLPEAIATLERALAARPDDVLLLEDLSQLCERAGRHDALTGVLRVLAERTANVPTKVALLHRAGRILVELSRDDEALAAFRAALALAPAHVPTLQAAEAVCRRRGDWQALVEIWTAEADGAPTAPRRARAFARIGELAETKLGDVERAVRAYERALELDAYDHRAFEALTRLYTSTRRHRELVALHERAIDATKDVPRRVAHLFRIGAIWEDDLGEPASAVQAYRRILAIDAANLTAIHALQRAAERAGRFAELAEAFDLEAKHTTDAAHRLALAKAAATVVLEQLNDLYGATLRFRRILEQSGHDETALAALGRIYYGQGRWDDLLAIHEKALDSSAKGAQAAELLFEMGEIAETKAAREDAAIAYYRRACDALPGHEPALRALHRLLRKRGEWRTLADVLETYARATEDPRAKAQLFYRAAQALEEDRQNPERAIAAYRAALAAQPGNRAAHEALGRLLDERRAWRELVGHLDVEAAGTSDPQRAAEAVLRQADVLRHALDERDRAIERYEALLQGERSRMPAILALELLYDPARRAADLAGIARAKAALHAEPSVHAAALVDLAALQEKDSELGDPETTLQSALGTPADRTVLAELERLALRSGDAGRIAGIDEHLARVATDGTIAAEHLARRGWAFAAADAASARGWFERALERDARCLPAIRGLEHVARSQRDARGTADALSRAAQWTRDPVRGADLLVEEAAIRRMDPEQIELAVECLARALDRAPDHELAASELAHLLGERAPARVIDVLSKAASAASRPVRVAALWRTVSELQARANDIGGAIASLRRALEIAPMDVSMLDRMAALHVDSGRWPDSVPFLEKILAFATTPAELFDARLRLAEAFSRSPDELGRASVELEAALKIHPDHPRALAVVIDVQRKKGDLEGAREVAQRLVTLTHGADAGALLALAHVERDRGDEASYVDALARAVAVAGPSSDAATELDEAAERPTVAKLYADALARFLGSAGSTPGDRASAYLEMARVYAERLEMRAKAVDTLVAALGACPGDQVIARELGQLFRGPGKQPEGIELLRRLVAQHPSNAGLWRALSTLFRDTGHALEADLACAPLIALGEASEPESRAYRRIDRSGLALAPGSMSSAVLAEIADPGVMAAPATRLLVALHDVIRKMRPDALQRALASRRSARASDRTRELCEQLGATFGVDELEVFTVEDATPFATVVASEPIAIVVTSALEAGPPARLAFLLGRAIAAIALRTYPAETMSAGELSLLLAGAAHLALPEHGMDRADRAEVQEEARLIKKALPWLGGKAITAAGAAYASAPAIDIEAWRRALRHASSRAAWLATGDLPECVAALAAMYPPAAAGARSVESPDATDLLSFVISAHAAEVRRQLGLV